MSSFDNQNDLEGGKKMWIGPMMWEGKDDKNTENHHLWINIYFLVCGPRNSIKNCATGGSHRVLILEFTLSHKRVWDA